jgi:hypothetical protein
VIGALKKNLKWKPVKLFYFQIAEGIKSRCKFTALMIISVFYWSEFLATDPEIRGSIPGAVALSQKQLFCNRDHSVS